MLLAAALLVTACAGGDGADGGGAAEPPDSDQNGTEQNSADQDDADHDAEAEREQRLQELAEEYDAALAGPAEQHTAEAAEYVADMTVEQQAGQVLIGEYEGTDAAAAAQLIEDLHLAGIILMGHNIPGGTDDVDTAALSEQIETISAAGGSDEAEERAAAPIISVDQEGGLVTRVGAPLTEWPTPMAYGAAYEGVAAGDADADEQSLEDYDLLTAVGHQAMGADLAELGFTMDFAPNADVTIGADDPTMGTRSFGGRPDVVADLALAGLRGLAEAGIPGSAKHFPGHGSVTEDSHVTLPEQPAEIDELTDRDWAPFSAVIEAGAPMIMIGHLDVPALDPGMPSSLSAPAYEQLREMGHDGVVVTDALNMAAVVDSHGPAQAPVMALDAGADLLLMPSDVRAAHGAIVDAVESGELPGERLNEAAERVVALMLWQQDLARGELDAGPGVPLAEVLQEEPPEEDQESAVTAREVSSQAVTLVEGTCEAELISEVEPVAVAGGTERDRSLLGAALTDAGYTVGAGGTEVSLMAPEGSGAGGDVAVALDRPEQLEQSAASTRIALYARTQEAFEALVEVLGGQAAPGALPVPVGDRGPGHSAC